MRLTMPDGSKAFMRRDYYKAVHEIVGGAEFARHLPQNGVLLSHLPNRLTCEEIVARAAAKETQVAPDHASQSDDELESG